MTPERHLEISRLLQSVSYRDWSFRTALDGHRLVLQVAFMAPDADTGAMCLQTGRKWFLSAYMTDSEVVSTAFKAVLTAEEHEVRERFHYRGRPIFGPHFDVDRLWDMAGDGDATDVREAA